MYWLLKELAIKLKPLIRLRARAQQGARTDLSQNSGKGLKPIHTDKQLAKLAGVSPDTIARVAAIQKKANEQTKEALRKGETSINAEYHRLRVPGIIYSSLSNDWYTPAIYVEAARNVLAEIDLDPASCRAANRILKANPVSDTHTDGLSHDWPGRVWLNPPYGGLSGPFTVRLLSQYRSGITTAAPCRKQPRLDTTIPKQW